MIKYLIFATELIVIVLWLKFGSTDLWTRLAGVAVIIIASQSIHMLLKAR